MNTASFSFLAFALIAASAYNAGKSIAWRQWTFLAASIFFLSTFSRNLVGFLPLIGFLILGFIGLRAMCFRATRKFYVPCVVLTVGAFVWLKKYTFLPPVSFLGYAYVTIGLSYILFKVLHLLIEAHASPSFQKVSFVSYLNYTLNFMTLVSGPIDRYEHFAEEQLVSRRAPLTIFQFGEGIHRIVVGFFKVVVLSWLLIGLQKESLDALSAGQASGMRILTGVAIAISYPLYLYANFSGYTDIVIGVGRFFHFTLPENFDRPFAADNLMSFWNRWHMTLSGWLKRYVYDPLLLNLMRRAPSKAWEPYIGGFALFVTFFLVGVWHGRTSEFVVFGLSQGVGVGGNQMYQILLAKRLGRAGYRTLTSNFFYLGLSRGLTFAYFTFSLFWFWSTWRQIGAIGHSLGASGVLSVMLLTFLGSTILLSVSEAVRSRVLSIKRDAKTALQRRYVLTVVDTALMVVSLWVVALLNIPTPDIVYKAF